jgi:uroporphyrinogen-III synthase
VRLLVTRPEPDAAPLKARLEALGLAATVEPLLRLAPAERRVIDLADAQALIATSRNALRALGAHPACAGARRLPLFAVGRATADAARALGFAIVVTGAGTAEQLLAHIVGVVDPAAGVLIHLAGDAQAVDLKGELEAHGFRVQRHVLYHMRASQALSAATVEQLAEGEIDGVILLSPRTAAIYAGLVRRQGLARAARRLVHFCVSSATAARLDTLGAVPVAVADRPRLEEVLALVAAAAAKSPPGAG